MLSTMARNCSSICRSGRPVAGTSPAGGFRGPRLVPIPVLVGRAREGRLKALSGDAADSGKLESGMREIDAGDEPQHVELEAFVAARDDTEEAGERRLVTGAAWRVREEFAGGQIVLADSIG